MLRCSEDEEPLHVCMFNHRPQLLSNSFFLLNFLKPQIAVIIPRWSQGLINTSGQWREKACGLFAALITLCLDIKPNAAEPTVSKSAGNGLTSPSWFIAQNGHPSPMQGHFVWVWPSVSGPQALHNPIPSRYDVFYHGRCQVQKWMTLGRWVTVCTVSVDRTHCNQDVLPQRPAASF